MSDNYCFVGVFNETTWPSWTEDPPNPIYSRSKAQAVATSIYFLVRLWFRSLFNKLSFKTPLTILGLPIYNLEFGMEFMERIVKV